MLDVTDEAQVAEAARTATDVALLINNAGYWGESSSFMTLDVAKARREMDVNYFGLLSVTSVFALALKASSGGAVLNVLSFLALATWPVSGTYASSKAAALAVTRSRRAELAAQGTAVIGVMPVQVEAGMGQIMPPPRVAPQEVAVDALDAVEQGVDEVFPGELSRQSAKAFAAISGSSGLTSSRSTTSSSADRGRPDWSWRVVWPKTPMSACCCSRRAATTTSQASWKRANAS